MRERLRRTREDHRIKARLMVHAELIQLHCDSGHLLHNASTMATADLAEMRISDVMAKANELRRNDDSS